MLALAEELLTVWASFRDGEIDRAMMQGKLEAIQAAMREHVEGYRQHTNTLGTLCSELHKRWNALWTFVEVEGVEPTNDAAERALRPAVLWRKGCYGTQSEGGTGSSSGC